VSDVYLASGADQGDLPPGSVQMESLLLSQYSEPYSKLLFVDIIFQLFCLVVDSSDTQWPAKNFSRQHLCVSQTRLGPSDLLRSIAVLQSWMDSTTSWVYIHAALVAQQSAGSSSPV